MNQDELIEKCRLTPKQLRQIWDDTESYDSMDDWREKVRSNIAEAQLRKAIPIIEAEARKAERERIKTAPPIICLCGSTMFTREMLIKQWELTKQGYIVVSWCALPDDYYEGEDKSHIGDKENVKELVDEVHKRKIDLCDEVFVLNIGGYIGESTASEISYAKKLGKPIKYWQALKGECDGCLLYTSPSPRDLSTSRMPSSA